jgi:hypothetical protein
MELNKIEQLLDKYFDAETTVAEEQQLKAYFASGNVAPHLEQYRDMFGYFNAQDNATYNKPLVFEQKRDYRKWISVAASVVLLAGMVTWFSVIENTTNQQELGTYDNPEQAFQETQKALNMLSKNVNVGVEGMSYIGEYEKTRTSIFKK